MSVLYASLQEAVLLTNLSLSLFPFSFSVSFVGSFEFSVDVRRTMQFSSESQEVSFKEVGPGKMG